MRRFRCLWLLPIALTLCAAPAPTRALGAADGPGCLGVTLDQCVGWLRASMRLDESFLATALAQRRQLDVNGRPLGGGGLVTVNAKLPDRVDQLVILLHLRPDDTVRSVESNLLGDLIQARTEPVYDQSGFYEIAWRLLGRRCAGMAKLDLYRFFENTVKPRITQQREDFSGGLFGMHRVISHATAVPYCGASLAYTNMREWHGSSDPRAASRVKNFSYIELQ
jgi:hypothetical protein